MIVLSNSQTQMWQHSPRCYWWRYVLGIVPKSEGSPDPNRSWGDMIHKGFDLLYQGHGVSEAMKLMDLSVLETLKETGDFHTVATLRRALDEYAKTVLPEDLARYDVLSTEKDHICNLSTTVSWLGKLDLVLREKSSGLVSIFDHKTTSKKVDSSYWTDQFSHDQQMTSYWWLGQNLYGDEYDGLQINALQTTKTIGYNHARFPVSRDDWQIDEWYANIIGLGPRIAYALEIGKQMYAAGLRETDPEVLAMFPICNTYSENFCDYRFLNQCPPDFRETMIANEFVTRSQRGGDMIDSVDGGGE